MTQPNQNLSFLDQTSFIIASFIYSINNEDILLSQIVEMSWDYSLEFYYRLRMRASGSEL